MNNFGLNDNKDTYQKLINAYPEKHRHYHREEHINACLKHLSKVKHLADKFEEIEMALWFHDVVYKPTSTNNELNSANWAVEFLRDNNIDQTIIDRVFKLIIATLHNCPVENKDEKLMVDIDLTILGASPEIYKIFEQNIRKEYKWVPYFYYRKKRKEILTSFLNHGRIYKTSYFFDLFENQARENINTSILRL